MPGRPPFHLRLVYLDPVTDAVASRSLSFVNTGGDLHVWTMDFDPSGRHLLYRVTAGTRWRASAPGAPAASAGRSGSTTTPPPPSW